MAVKVLTLANITAFNSFVDVASEAATVASDGFEVTADGDIMLFVQNAGSTDRTLTVKAGTAMQGVADVVSAAVGSAGVRIIKLSGGEFKNITGSNKGKYKIIPSHVELQVKAFKY